MKDSIDDYGSDAHIWAARLEALESAANRGRGVPIVRTIIARLREGRIDSAATIVEVEWDTIRTYSEIVYVLKLYGLAPAWWV